MSALAYPIATTSIVQPGAGTRPPPASPARCGTAISGPAASLRVTRRGQAFLTAPRSPAMRGPGLPPRSMTATRWKLTGAWRRRGNCTGPRVKTSEEHFEERARNADHKLLQKLKDLK